MLWVVFAVLMALFESMKQAFSKFRLKDFDEYKVAWASRVFALPILLPIALFAGIPSIGNGFFLALLISGSLNVVTTVLYMKAIKVSDMSLSVPILSFSPVFLLFTSYIALGEMPDAAGIAGVLLVVFGAYVLNISKFREGVLAPIRALVSEPGPRMMLVVAFIWSITSVYDKVGVVNSSPVFWTLAIFSFVSLALTPIANRRDGGLLRGARKHFKALFPIGVFGGIANIFQMMAFSLTLVVYVSAIKRAGAVISVLVGGKYFGEKNMKERILGAALMVIGVLMITMF